MNNVTKTGPSSRGTLASLSEQQRELLKQLTNGTRGQSSHWSPQPRAIDESSIELPASWAQERLWFLDQLGREGLGYRIPMAIRLQGALDREALGKSLDSIVRRHEALRTMFVSVGGVPKQKIAPEVCFDLKEIDLTSHEADHQEELVREHKCVESHARFKLEVGPLVRGRLLRLAADVHVLMITMHHIISDGWSTDIFVRELVTLYRAYRQGKQDPLSPLPIQYADYAIWQRQWLQGERLETHISYWRQRLQGSEPELDLPTDRSRSPLRSHHGANTLIALDAALCGELRALAARHRMTLFMVVYAAWTILLHRLSGQEDIVVGTPVANRNRPELEGLIGFFVNTIVLRIDVRSDTSLSEFFARVKSVAVEAFDHQDAPFEQVVQALRPDRRLTRNPLFQVMFALQSAMREDIDLGELVGSHEDIDDELSIVDLFMSMEERAGEILCTLNYATELFDEKTIGRWGMYYVQLLKEMVSDQPRFIHELQVMPEAERRRIIESFSCATTGLRTSSTICEMFEAQVARSPNALAALHGDEKLTYGELNAKANQLARHLRHRQLGHGMCVAVLMERSPMMLIAQLAVLKAGGAFVPLDPDLPVQRRGFIIKDCGASLILVDGERFTNLSAGWVRCDDVFTRHAALSRENLDLEIDPLLPAYVMYTSGSTGRPKGVVVPHRAIKHLILDNGYADIDSADCVAHCSNPAFDASTFEVWGALLTGARLVVVPQSDVLNPRRLKNVLVAYGVTVLWMTTGLFSQYVDALGPVFTRLRYLLIGGDVADAAALARVVERGSPQKFLNAYGPTECTTFATMHVVKGPLAETAIVPIGRPISNSRVYILDSRLRPAPIGVAGEIYIGGMGVALGYLGNPMLSAERFIADPYSDEAGGRAYRTGDLGRWLEEGEIEFLGRNDQQVKIRGFRVELPEIEAHLRNHPRVEDAAVVVREHDVGDKRLVAYVVSSCPTEVGVEELRACLRGLLPEFMVPSAFVVLRAFPLNANGKLDRRALPTPQIEAYTTKQYETPQGEIEGALAEIWKDLLKVERVGRKDNFFELGGHSLVATRVISRVTETFDVDLPLRALFESPTVELLCDRILQEIAAEVRMEAT